MAKAKSKHPFLMGFLCGLLFWALMLIVPLAVATAVLIAQRPRQQDPVVRLDLTPPAPAKAVPAPQVSLTINLPQHRRCRHYH